MTNEDTPVKQFEFLTVYKIIKMISADACYLDDLPCFTYRLMACYFIHLYQGNRKDFGTWL